MWGPMPPSPWLLLSDLAYKRFEIECFEDWVNGLISDPKVCRRSCTDALRHLQFLQMDYTKTYAPICSLTRTAADFQCSISEASTSCGESSSEEEGLEFNEFVEEAVHQKEEDGERNELLEEEKDGELNELLEEEKVAELKEFVEEVLLPKDGDVIRTFRKSRRHQPALSSKWRRVNMQKRHQWERDSAALTEKCTSLCLEVRKAMEEKSTTASACLREWAEIEAALEYLAGEARVLLPPKVEADDVEGSDVAEVCRGHALGARIRFVTSTLLVFVQNAQKAKKVLAEGLTCPLSHEIFRRPMLAPDGQVYEKAMIVKWLTQKPFSPLSQQLMRPSQLLRDRAVEQAVAAWWLLQGEVQPIEECEAEEIQIIAEGPEARASSEAESAARSGLPGDASVSLHGAITSRDAVVALDLLQQEDGRQLEGLNQRHGEEGASLLHLALLNEMPSVAVAIVNHRAFSMHRAGLHPHNVTPLHMAAALGRLDVCEALVRRCGGGVIAGSVRCSTTLSLHPSGRRVELLRGRNAAEIAGLSGHQEIVSMMRAATRAYLSRSEQSLH